MSKKGYEDYKWIFRAHIPSSPIEHNWAMFEAASFTSGELGLEFDEHPEELVLSIVAQAATINEFGWLHPYSMSELWRDNFQSLTGDVQLRYLSGTMNPDEFVQLLADLETVRDICPELRP